MLEPAVAFLERQQGPPSRVEPGPLHECCVGESESSERSSIAPSRFRHCRTPKLHFDGCPVTERGRIESESFGVQDLDDVHRPGRERVARAVRLIRRTSHRDDSLAHDRRGQSVARRFQASRRRPCLHERVVALDRVDHSPGPRAYPPTRYAAPSTTAQAKPVRRLGIGDFADHEFDVLLYVKIDRSKTAPILWPPNT